MEKKFRALRVIATIFKVFAWISLIGSILSSLFLIITGILNVDSLSRASSAVPGLDIGGILGVIFATFMVLVLGVFYFLAFYAFGEFIYVLLSIEENTRLTALALSGRTSG